MKHQGNCVVGIDLGGTNMQAVVIDQDNHIIGHAHRVTNAARGVGPVIDDLVQAAHSSADAAHISHEDIQAIGIAAPGAINMSSGVVIEAPNLGWRNVALSDEMAKRMQLPVVVENDVNAAAWGEFCIGAGRPFSNMLAVWVGTGVGGGLVLEDRLFHGAAHSGGELGQTVVEPGGRVMEHHVGRIGMTRLVRAWGSSSPESPLHCWVDRDEQVPTQAIADALSQGDALALRIIEHASRHLGAAIANCVTLLGLEAVVIGGGITETLDEQFIQPVREAFAHDVFPKSAGATPLLLTELTSSAGTLGAAMLARDACNAHTKH